ncbi:MAG: abortive infection family protein [Planctomycetes bacterium]|nr:abortive infection family protein [Planctomycetota bacterium]
MAGLTNQEIMIIVNRYIGVSGGYLGDFSYRTHTEFYPMYCNLDINPNQLEGTTRERFIEIIKGSPPDIQAKILRGVLQRFPLDAEYKSATRTTGLFEQLESVISRLENASPISSPSLRITSTAVEQAISDTEIMIQTGSPISGVDRIHTALHGYLCAVCDRVKIPYSKDDSMAKLFKALRQNHPALINLGARSQDIERILQSSACIMDALNPIRNNASIAHPNQDLLDKEEAMLVINVARTLLHYLDSKIGE